MKERASAEHKVECPTTTAVRPDWKPAMTENLFLFAPRLFQSVRENRHGLESPLRVDKPR
jgi:hypothetical protein